jgi:pyrimidine operon attenuation protein/uracil phosphoribosyltransferase
MTASASELPDAEALYRQLAIDIKRYVAEKNLQQPLLIGIRTGGAWLAQRLQLALELPELGILDISFYRDDFDERLKITRFDRRP